MSVNTSRSRLTWREVCPQSADERKETAPAFWLRTNVWFAEHGITVRKVLKLGGIEHRRTQPYRTQINGKVERFHGTLARE